GDAGDARQVEPQVEHQGDAQHEQPQGHGSPRMSDLIREAGQESSDGVHGGYCSSTRLCTRGGGAVRDRSAGGSVRGISWVAPTRCREQPCPPPPIRPVWTPTATIRPPRRARPPCWTVSCRSANSSPTTVTTTVSPTTSART